VIGGKTVKSALGLKSSYFYNQMHRNHSKYSILFISDRSKPPFSMVVVEGRGESCPGVIGGKTVKSALGPKSSHL
jgi:hypothetical protein